MGDAPSNDTTPVRRDLSDRLADKAVHFLNDADAARCWDRVAQARAKSPDTSPDDLADALIRKKCLKTGGIGAITSAPATIPGLGTVATLTFGSGVDITLTYRLQAELVLEIAECYGVRLSPLQQRTTLLLITGISAGSTALFKEAGKRLAVRASEHLAQRSMAKAIPVIGVGASAGINMAATYAIGKRAKAYFSQGETAMQDWGESLRTISGVDERKLISWLGESGETGWRLIGESARGAGDKFIALSQATGELVSELGRKVSERTRSLFRRQDDLLDAEHLEWLPEEPPPLPTSPNATSETEEQAPPIRRSTTARSATNQPTDGSGTGPGEE